MASTTVYWRPGCGYCSGLKRALDGHGLEYDQINIWDEPDAAAFVRGVANGNETVPTVRIGEQVALVNPSAHDVLRELALVAPSEVPEGYAPPEVGRMGRALNRVLGG